MAMNEEKKPLVQVTISFSFSFFSDDLRLYAMNNGIWNFLSWFSYHSRQMCLALNASPDIVDPSHKFLSILTIMLLS